MDDLTFDDEGLDRTLRQLRHVNRYLGGHRALRRAVTPLLRWWSHGTLTVLDLGSGLCDHTVELMEWGRRHGVSLDVTAVDANPAVVEVARTYLEGQLPPGDRKSARIITANALELPFAERSFHVVTASLFLHHFDDDRAVWLLKEMARRASVGIIVNDLHRHPLAYAGIRAIAAVLPVSPTFRHDGPLSVRRAFKPRELRAFARAAGLTNARVRRHWPFRLTLSTLPATETSRL